MLRNRTSEVSCDRTCEVSCDRTSEVSCNRTSEVSCKVDKGMLRNRTIEDLIDHP